jgi:ribosome biogenesis GTPase A
MTKSIRMMRENIKLVDIVIEILDARIPRSSANPDIIELAKGKKRLTVLNKSDLADPEITKLWVKHFEGKALAVNSIGGDGFGELAKACHELTQEKLAKAKRQGRLSIPIRAMIAGIPNSGKSTLINRFVGKNPAKTGNKPGVTRGRQWIRLKQGFDLLDTPGILWPKIEDESVGVNLAITGAISDNVPDALELAAALIRILEKYYPLAISERYKLEANKPNPDEDNILNKIALARGYEKQQAESDIDRAASALINDFRSGRLGRISLEKP